MPTLIRLFVFLLILAGLVFGAMVALTVFVEPQPGEVTVRIPTRDLFAGEDAAAEGEPQAEEAPAPAPVQPIPGG